MKLLNPFLLVLVGVLITVTLFSFKNEEPKKEYCRVSYEPGSRVPIELAYENRIDQIQLSKEMKPRCEAMKQIEKMTSEGWKIISSSTCAIGGPSYVYEKDIIYLERTKQ